MKDIVYYRNTHEIFDIDAVDGISFYIIDAVNTHKKKRVIGLCKVNERFNFDDIHDEKDVVLLGRDILNIIGKCGMLGLGFKQSLYVKNTDTGEKSIMLGLGFKRCTFVGEQERGAKDIPTDYVQIMQGTKVVGYKKKKELFTQVGLDKWKSIVSIMIGGAAMIDNGTVLGSACYNHIAPNQVPKGSFPVVKYFDTEDECKSFESYMMSRLMSFLFYIGIVGATMTSEFFRFVPDPVKFDHIFTDKELYDKYGLTQKEINIIESVIKERK
jgi:hypothetical protein